MLTTVHSVCNDADSIMRLRKISSPTSTNAVESRRRFDTTGSRSRMLLPVPRVVNDYNAHMGGVNIVDQYRSTYKTQQKAYRIWFPLFIGWSTTQRFNAFKVGGQLAFWTDICHVVIMELDASLSLRRSPASLLRRSARFLSLVRKSSRYLSTEVRGGLWLMDATA